MVRKTTDKYDSSEEEKPNLTTQSSTLVLTRISFNQYKNYFLHENKLRL